MIFNFKFAVECIPQMLSALPITLLLTLIGLIFSTIFGFLLAMARIHKVKFWGRFAQVYLAIMRGVPIMVQLYLVFVALPIAVQSIAASMGHDGYVDVPPMLIAAVALSMNYTAYMSEVIRAAIQSVDFGQQEAALSIGMTNAQMMRRVVIPQALVEAIPNLGNTFIGLIKDTSLAYMVMVMDIMGMAKKLAGAGLNFLETYVVAALIYWGLNFCLERIFGAWEKKASFYTRPSRNPRIPARQDVVKMEAEEPEQKIQPVIGTAAKAKA